MGTRTVAFAKLVEVNEYSPVSTEDGADWQTTCHVPAAPSVGEDDDIQEGFLELKKIDKPTSCKNTTRPPEKSMLELIEECKCKNTTYETLMNTWKNSTAVISLYSQTPSYE